MEKSEVRRDPGADMEIRGDRRFGCCFLRGEEGVVTVVLAEGVSTGSAGIPAGERRMTWSTSSGYRRAKDPAR